MNQQPEIREVTVNLHRGFLALGRQIAARFPRGLEFWESWLKDVTGTALNHTLPAGEIPLFDLPDRIAAHRRVAARRPRRRIK